MKRDEKSHKADNGRVEVIQPRKTSRRTRRKYLRGTKLAKTI